MNTEIANFVKMASTTDEVAALVFMTSSEPLWVAPPRRAAVEAVSTPKLTAKPPTPTRKTTRRLFHFLKYIVDFDDTSIYCDDFMGMRKLIQSTNEDVLNAMNAPTNERWKCLTKLTQKQLEQHRLGNSTILARPIYNRVDLCPRGLIRPDIDEHAGPLDGAEALAKLQCEIPQLYGETSNRGHSGYLIITDLLPVPIQRDRVIPTRFNIQQWNEEYNRLVERFQHAIQRLFASWQVQAPVEVQGKRTVTGYDDQGNRYLALRPDPIRLPRCNDDGQLDQFCRSTIKYVDLLALIEKWEQMPLPGTVATPLIATPAPLPNPIKQDAVDIHTRNKSAILAMTDEHLNDAFEALGVEGDFSTLTPLQSQKILDWHPPRKPGKHRERNIIDTGSKFLNRVKCAARAIEPIRSTLTPDTLTHRVTDDATNEADSLYVKNNLNGGERDENRDQAFREIIKWLVAHPPNYNGTGSELWFDLVRDLLRCQQLIHAAVKPYLTDRITLEILALTCLITAKDHFSSGSIPTTAFEGFLRWAGVKGLDDSINAEIMRILTKSGCLIFMRDYSTGTGNGDGRGRDYRPGRKLLDLPFLQNHEPAQQEAAELDEIQHKLDAGGGNPTSINKYIILSLTSMSSSWVTDDDQNGQLVEVHPSFQAVLCSLEDEFHDSGRLLVI